MNKFVPSNVAVTVSEIVEGAGFRRPLLMIIGLCFLLMICDSYDVAALSFAAPVLIKQWHTAVGSGSHLQHRPVRPAGRLHPVRLGG